MLLHRRVSGNQGSQLGDSQARTKPHVTHALGLCFCGAPETKVERDRAVFAPLPVEARVRLTDSVVPIGDLAC